MINAFASDKKPTSAIPRIGIKNREFVNLKTGEKFAIGFEIQSGETPASMSITIDPVEAGGLATTGGVAISNNTIFQSVEGGIVDRIYKALLTITCTSGSIYTPMIIVKMIY